MSENSKIEWTDHTFNPWMGCTKVSAGCDHCYAEALMDTRYGKVHWGVAQPRVRTSVSNWQLPLRWERQAEAFKAQHGRRQRVFCASLADVFDNAIDPQWRVDLFNLILSTPSLDWLLLTKRVGNAAQMIEETLPENMKALPPDSPVAWPWPNVWIGATIVNQAEADRDIPKLDAVPAAVRFLSMEPLLGPVDIGWDWLWGSGGCNGIDWVIVGGESGQHARPMHPDWARSLRDQCAAAGVPMLFKQWGEWGMAPELHKYQTTPRITVYPDGRLEDWEPFSVGYGPWCMHRAGKKAAGRLLDGVQHDGFPS